MSFQPIKRHESLHVAELKIPRSLEKDLPFATRSKWERKKLRCDKTARDKLMGRAVIRETKDKEVFIYLLDFALLTGTLKQSLAWGVTPHFNVWRLGFQTSLAAKPLNTMLI